MLPHLTTTVSDVMFPQVQEADEPAKKDRQLQDFNNLKCVYILPKGHT